MSAQLQNRYDNLSLRTKGQLVLSLPVVALLALSASTAIKKMDDREAARWAVRTREVPGTVERMLRFAVEADAGVQGYLLGGSQSSLESYRSVKVSAPAQLDSLRGILADSPSQLLRLKEVDAGLRGQFEQLDHTLGAWADSSGSLEEGRQRMERLQGRLTAVLAEEERLVGERAAREARIETIASALVASALAIGLLGGVAAILTFATIRRRIGALKEGVARLADRVPLGELPTGTDEIGSLAVSLATAGALLRDRAEALENALDGIARVDADGRYAVVNQAFASVTGREPRELIQQHWMDIVHPEDREALRIAFLGMRISGKTELEVRCCHRDGGVRHVDLAIIAVRETAGGFSGHRCFLTDITARKQAEGDAAHANAGLEGLLDAATMVAIIACDLNWRITVFNAGAERMLGFRAAEVVGRHPPEMFHLPSECQEREISLSEELGEPVRGSDVFTVKARRGEADEREWTFVRKDGSHVSVSLVVTAKRDGAGQVVGYLCIARDISGQKGTAAELLRARDAAEAASVAKSDFLAKMSHEIRTPMTSILGMSDLLWETPLSDDQRTYVAAFRRNAAALTRLVNEILDLSKVEAGRLQLEVVPFDPCEIVRQTVDLLLTPARRKGLDLRLQVESEIPPAVAGDPGRLQQILTNLADNAVKFTRTGFVEVGLRRVQESGMETALEFRVTDTGPGIPEEERVNIFSAFRQADSSIARRFGGTGLGLAIGQRLAQALGGRLEVQSEPGRGSTFLLTLPFAPANAAPAATVAHEPAGTQTGRELRILFADDSEDNRFLIGAYLKDRGIRLEFAENGVDAIEKAISNNYDLILMDVRMPVVDGLSATQAIRRWEREQGKTPIPILALTADALPDAVERSLAAGCTAHLVKPLDRATLLDQIARYTSLAAPPAVTRVQVAPELKEIVPLFLRSRQADVEKLRTALAQNDFERLRILGHNMKGSGGGYGFQAISDIGRTLESAAKQGDTTGVQVQIDGLAKYLAEVEVV